MTGFEPGGWEFESPRARLLSPGRICCKLEGFRQQHILEGTFGRMIDMWCVRETPEIRKAGLFYDALAQGILPCAGRKI